MLPGHASVINKSGYSVMGVFSDSDTTVTTDTHGFVRVTNQGMRDAN